ncbi:universal stress protein [Companilactobacillus pabuli]|jgi:Universal stress protein UspA and related nucleotide-binding proteins|uniref:Universal stress protein n=1 Tax=Companilactobacillus pabuli TaxID=2714036 RepID=A0A7L7KX97_9LACO|nr:universal stress protein [Companilactobacillus pabuli]AKP03606.1 universal stress protein UspA [Companilactobacillus farciminis]AKS51911.1 universal stress protein UspA [Companilactobacillus farciminis]MDG5112813.1 universal stress protein [Companilactobacillus pabuli]QMT84411.1 universal stress protein [Companilactobacillus pabuli]GAQ00455.1 universal stress protein UspA [Companilactobacillus farciminis]
MDYQEFNEPLVYRRILLTVDEDDNESTIKAFRFATTMAHDYDARLGIVSVLESDDINIFDSLTPAKLKEKRNELQAVVDNYVKMAENLGLKKVDPLVYDEGDVDDVIVDRAIPDFKPDLIVTGADTALPHSKITATIGPRLAKKAPVSVIVVR